MSPYFTTWNPARGGCGHQHKHHDTAKLCARRDQRRNSTVGNPLSRGIWRVAENSVFNAQTGLQVLDAVMIAGVMEGTDGP